MNTSSAQSVPIGLVVSNLVVTYPSRNRGFKAMPNSPSLNDVSFELQPGRSIGIVGESGSGKTTLGNCIAGILTPTRGSVTLGGSDQSVRSRRRRHGPSPVQMIFQSSSGSLNPKRSVGHSIALPLLCSRTEEVERKVGDLLEIVGLRRSDAWKLPHEFSGGQRQRINIARAIATNPAVIVCDEPTSGLDVSVQAQICNLLRQISADYGTSYVFISHDLAVVQMMTDDILVLNHGVTVDALPAGNLLNSTNPYTRSLIDAIPGTATIPDGLPE